MGIGCRRDPLEANVWYVRAAEAGDERAKHRLAAIRAAVSGEDLMAPVAVEPKPQKPKKLHVKSNSVGDMDRNASPGLMPPSQEQRRGSDSGTPKKDDKECVVM